MFRTEPQNADEKLAALAEEMRALERKVARLDMTTATTASLLPSAGQQGPAGSQGPPGPPGPAAGNDNVTMLAWLGL